MSKLHIANRQFMILTFGLTVGTSVLVTPAGLADMAREDAWLASLGSLGLNMLMVGLYIVLGRMYPDRTLFEINEIVLGKWLGKMLTMIYLFYVLILAGTLLGNLGFFFTTEIFLETPIEAIQILFLLAVIMCARLGVSVLARMGELMFPWIVFLFLVLAFTLLPQAKPHHILPMLEDGFAPVLKAALHSSAFQEVIIMMMFVPLVRTPKLASKAYLTGTLLGCLLLAIVALLSILVLGIEQSANSTFPAYALAKTINIGNFFQRVEGILITIWVLTFFLKTMLLFFTLQRGVRTLTGLKEEQSLVYPLTLLFLVVAWNTYVNTVYVTEVIAKVWAGYSLIHLVVFPLLLLAIGAMRKRVAAAKH